MPPANLCASLGITAAICGGGLLGSPLHRDCPPLAAPPASELPVVSPSQLVAGLQMSSPPHADPADAIVQSVPIGSNDEPDAPHSANLGHIVRAQTSDASSATLGECVSLDNAACTANDRTSSASSVASAQFFDCGSPASLAENEDSQPPPPPPPPASPPAQQEETASRQSAPAVPEADVPTEAAAPPPPPPMPVPQFDGAAASSSTAEGACAEPEFPPFPEDSETLDCSVRVRRSRRKSVVGKETLTLARKESLATMGR